MTNTLNRGLRIVLRMLLVFAVGIAFAQAGAAQNPAMQQRVAEIST